MAMVRNPELPDDQETDDEAHHPGPLIDDVLH
jgi:hypothetical protein